MVKRKFNTLISANRQVIYLNAQKQKRASELVIANIELLYQNAEKGKREAELLIANKKLIFDNSEKEKRACELALAYSELQLIEKSQKEYITSLEKMLFMVSHEVRQPLTQILGLSFLMEQLNPSEPLKRMLCYLRESSSQLDTFTKKLTNYLHALVQKTKRKK